MVDIKMGTLSAFEKERFALLHALMEKLHIVPHVPLKQVAICIVLFNHVPQLERLGLVVSLNEEIFELEVLPHPLPEYPLVKEIDDAYTHSRSPILVSWSYAPSDRA